MPLRNVSCDTPGVAQVVLGFVPVEGGEFRPALAEMGKLLSLHVESPVTPNFQMSNVD